MKFYLAGPDVFHPEASALGAAKRARIEAAGGVALWPLDSVIDADAETHPKPLLARAIYQANCAMIDEADGVLANLTPFRGPSADAGTVFEVGYAVARGRPVFGYSNTAAPFAARSRAFKSVVPDDATVENFDLQSDNLMIHCALTAFAARAAADPWRDLAAFDEALAVAVAAFKEVGP